MGKKRSVERKKADGGTLKPKVNPENVVVRVKEFAGPLLDSEHMELVHVEFQREASGWVLRIYVDKEGSVTLDDCARISRQLGDLLDVGLENVWPYHLEVSSPGANRPLGKLSDFERFRGHQATIKIRAAIDGQKNFKGILQGSCGETIHLLVEDKTVTIPFQGIVRARLA